jgi:hypothetical protein
MLLDFAQPQELWRLALDHKRRSAPTCVTRKKAKKSMRAAYYCHVKTAGSFHEDFYPFPHYCRPHGDRDCLSTQSCTQQAVAEAFKCSITTTAVEVACDVKGPCLAHRERDVGVGAGVGVDASVGVGVGVAALAQGCTHPTCPPR